MFTVRNLQQTLGSSSTGALDNETVTVLEISQYTFQEMGSSACTSIAFAALATILERFDNKVTVNDATFLSDAIISGVTNYSDAMNGSDVTVHSSADELWERSSGCLLQQQISKIGESFQGLLTEENAFQKMISKVKEMRDIDPEKHIGIIITKPPETVCIIIPPINSQISSANAFFDSHSRPEYMINGSYLVTSNNVDSILFRLNLIFPPNAIDFDVNDTYMRMLYTSFESTVFQRI
jgi:hypothetical protein